MVYISSSSGNSIEVDGGTITGGIINNSNGIIMAIQMPIVLKNLTSNLNITLNGGRIIGNITDENYQSGQSSVTIGGDFTTEGNIQVSTLTVNANKTFTLSGDTTATLNNQPNSNGTFAFEVDHNASRAGKLSIQGAGQAVNLNGATINAVVGGSSGFLNAGTEILVAQGNAALIGISGGAGQALTTISDTSLLFDFEIADGGQTEITTSTG